MEVKNGRGRGRRGRPIDNSYLREEIRTLRARLEVLEVHRPHEHTRYTSDEEEEVTAETPELRILK